MEALIPLFLAVTVLVLLDMAAAAFGADSRDGFNDEQGPPGLW
jgi:hypothetical protein